MLLTLLYLYFGLTFVYAFLTIVGGGYVDYNIRKINKLIGQNKYKQGFYIPGTHKLYDSAEHKRMFWFPLFQAACISIVIGYIVYSIYILLNYKIKYKIKNFNIMINGKPINQIKTKIYKNIDNIIKIISFNKNI